MKRALLIVAIALAIAACGGWWYVFHTRAGLDLVLARLANLRTVRIEVFGAQGTLSDPLRFERISVDHDAVRIQVENLALQLAPAALLAQRVQVNSLQAARVRVDLKPYTSAGDKPPRFFPSFLQLLAHNINLADVQVANTDGFLQTAKRVRGTLAMTAQRLETSDVIVDGPYYTGTALVALRARKPIDLAVTAHLSMPAPRGTPFEVDAELRGPIDQLHLDAQLRSPSMAQFTGDITRGERRWQLSGALTSDRIALHPWLDNPPFSLTKVAVDVSASPDGIGVAGDITAPEIDAQALKVDLRGRYSNRVIALTRGEVQPSHSDLNMIVAGRIDLSAGKPAIAATAQWRNLRWPLRSDAFVSPEGQASFAGSLPYDIGVRGRIVAANIDAEVIGHGVLSRESIAFDQLHVNALRGEVAGTAQLGFNAPRAWRVALTGKQVDPSVVMNEAPGAIDFDITAQGKGLDRKADFAIELARLSGRLRGERLSGRGYLAHDAGGWTAREFAVRLGAARLAADGEWRKKINLRWQLEVPQLRDFIDTATGALHFQGTAQGASNAPQVQGTLVARNLSYAGWDAAEVTLAGNVDLSDRLVSQLELHARRIGRGEQRLAALHVTAHGKATAHQIAITATAAPRSLIKSASTELEGGYRDGAWIGRATPLAVVDADGATPSTSAAPAHIILAKDRINVDALCALWTDRKACGTLMWNTASGWRADVRTDSLPLNLFDDTFPERSRYQGRWQINGRFAGKTLATLAGSAVVQVSDASLAYQPIAGAEEIVKLGSGRVEVSAAPERMQASLNIVTPGTTSIDARAAIERHPDLALTNSRLSGELHAHTADANLLPLFFTDLDHSAGELDLRLNVGGSLANPQVSGLIDLQKGELALYRYNLSVRNLAATARIADNRVAFDGRAQLGQGQLSMSGELGWRKLEPVGALHLKGDNLLIADLPEYRIVASPNVDFKVDGRRIDVRGEVLIPSAHLEPSDLRGAVQISNDVRLIGERPEDVQSNLDVHSEVRVRMGEDVRLDTYGLQGKLGGAVMVITGNETAIGRGELNVSDGRYEAYGQKLEIARGRLLFDASPLGNPGIDIQAARRIEERRVGVNVRGTLRAPRVSLFAEPALPQSQIVSMLLTGKPIADLSNRDVATVGAAQDDLRLQGGGILASQIGRRLGLEEVGVESRGLNDTSLVLGKFLSPRLFVSYGISLTESINTLKLRYSLSDRWLVKTESGQNQSADVEFRIER